MAKDRKEHYHDKGEQDRSKEDYKSPHGIIDDLTTWSDDGMKRIRENNQAYKIGWKNTDDQIKGNKQHPNNQTSVSQRVVTG